jgi:hypothetical protein
MSDRRSIIPADLPTLIYRHFPKASDGNFASQTGLYTCTTCQKTDNQDWEKDWTDVWFHFL